MDQLTRAAEIELAKIHAAGWNGCRRELLNMNHVTALFDAGYIDWMHNLEMEYVLTLTGSGIDYLRLYTGFVTT